MRKLLSLLTALLFVGSMWGTNATLTFNNIGANLPSTADAENVKTATITATEGGTYTINYLNCKSLSNSIFLTAAASGGVTFFSNKTPIPGNIKSITVYTRESSSGDAAYHCAFNTTECTSRYVTGSTAVKIGANNSHTYTCSVEKAKYFCIAMNTAKNGQVIKIVVTYELIPTLTLSPKSLNFGDVAQGEDVDGQTFVVKGANLTKDLEISAPAGYTLSSETVTKSEAESNSGKTITVSPVTTNTGNFNGNITVGGAGSDFGEDSVIAVSMSVKAKHAVTITAPATGTGTLVIKDGDDAIGETVIEDKELTVIATPNTENHYIGGTITVKDDEDNDVTSTVYDSGTGILTMPDYDITVSVVFTPTYAITAAIVTGGTFSWEDDADNANPEYVAAGTLIQAAVESTATGYTFDSFDIYKTGESTTKVSHISGLFTMPAYAVTISGSFNKNTSPEIVLSQTSDYLFDDVAKGTSPAPTMTFTVSAANLGNNLTVAVSGTNADKFGLSENTITISEGGVENYEITVTPIVSAAGAFEATITVDDGEGGATAQSFDVIIEVLETYTAQWFVNGTELTAKAQTAVAGAALNVPEVTVSLVGKTFVGWIELDEDITAQDIEDAGGDLIENEDVITPSTMPNKNIQYRAVYATETKGAVTWEQTVITSLVTNDVIVIVGNNGSNYAMSNDGGTTDAPTAVSVTIATSKLSAAPAANIQWTFVLKGSNQYSFAAGEDTLYCINSNNGLRVGSGENNVFSITSDYLYNNGQGRYCGVYQSSDWRCYGTIHDNIKNQTFSFFKKVTAPSTFDNYVTKGARLLADPTFSVAEGAYATAQSVELAASEGDIYYTIDGTTPTSTSTKYTNAISISEYGETTINAIAIDQNGNSSEVASATYYIAYPSLDALVEADLDDETPVVVCFSNVQITVLDNTYGGVYVNVADKYSHNIELYAAKDPKTGWAVGGYVSGEKIEGVWYTSSSESYIDLSNGWTGINYTDTPTGFEDVETSVKAVKLLRNGVLLIEKNGKTYNAMGQLVK